MHAQTIGKLAIGSAAFGGAAASLLLFAMSSGPTFEAKLGILGVELSLSIGDAPRTTAPAYLEASMLRLNPDNRASGFALRVEKSGGLRAPASAPADETPVSHVSAPVAAPTEMKDCNA